MDPILIEKSPAPGKLDVLHVDAWPINKLAVGKHIRHYAVDERCYILAGQAKLMMDEQEPLLAEQGDLLIISAGSETIWDVTEEIEYHYYQTPPDYA